MKTTISERGQITLPKDLRRDLGIRPGTVLELAVVDGKFVGWKRESGDAILMWRGRGRLVICDAVVAEIRPALSSDAELLEFQEDLGLEFESCSFEAALLAGAMSAAYMENHGAARHVLPDFLIAAQARIAGAALLARDRGYYRDYFKELELIEP